MAFFYKSAKREASAYPYLEKLLRREYKQKVQLFVGLILTAIILLTLNFIFTPKIEIIRLTEIVVLLISLGIIFLGRDIYKNRKMQLHPLYRILMSNPQDIVWVYTINYEINSFGVYLFTRSSLVFNTLNKKQYILYGPSSEVKQARRALVPLLPHATFGFSKNLEQLYMASPLLLWNENMQLPDLEEEDLQ